MMYILCLKEKKCQLMPSSFSLNFWDYPHLFGYYPHVSVLIPSYLLQVSVPMDSRLEIKVFICEFNDVVIMSLILGPGSVDLDSVGLG